MNNPIHVLLAGDRDYSPYLLEGLTNKSFLMLPSGQLLERTLGALGGARELKVLLVVGPELLRPRIPRALNGKPTVFIEQRESFSENVSAALHWIQQHFQDGRPAIFVTNDAPLLTPAELDRFAAVVKADNADINIAVARIPETALQRPLVRQYIQSIVTLSDGLYLLANQVSLTPDAVQTLPAIQALFDLRKQSRLTTSVRTLLYALRRPRNLELIITWIRLIIAKRTWLKQPNLNFVHRIAVPVSAVESSLERFIGHDLRLRITEISDSLGCFDADTQQQLDELRAVIAAQSQLQSKAAHA